MAWQQTEVTVAAKFSKKNRLHIILDFIQGLVYFNQASLDSD
jgi:hypothetical protein